MTTGMITIGAFDFYLDGPLGATLGYNAAHGTDIHFFQDLIAYGGTRVRLNIKPDLYVANSMSASPSTWTWAFVDAVVLMANQNNIRCTLIARGLQPSISYPSWQEASSCAPGFDQTTIAGYTKIAVALARRYSGDGNPDNAVVGGKALQADCIEIGNEEINSMQDSSSYPYTGCRKAMRYVKLVRDVLTALRTPSSSASGGGWTPRGNFLARVGAWGIVHDQPNEITSTYGILTHPVLDATYNPSANSSSIFGFDSVLGVQLLDYANFHNYNAPDGSGGLTPAAECKQIRGILDGVGNTSIPIWCTEAGTNGPCAGATEVAQATYYAANADGSGGGGLQALKDAGCQHWDIFTLNYWGGSTNGAYVGQAMSVATVTTSGTYVRFQAHGRIANFMTLQDQGAWAAQAIPKGFGTQSGGGGGTPPPTIIGTVVATDTMVRANQSGFGTASDTVDVWVNTNETGTPTVSITSNKGKITGAANATGVELLGTLVETDCDAFVRTSFTASGDSAAVLLRANSGGTVYYRASLTGGNLTCHYFDGVTQNVLYTHAVTYTAGIANLYWIRFRIIGTSLMGRFWADGTTEPNDFISAAYAFTVTDATLASGKFGVRGRVGTTSDVILFDSFTAESIVTVTPPPPGTGTLTGAFAPLAAATINLSTEGLGDWAHWNGTLYDHSSTGGSQISNFTTVGNAVPAVNPTALNTFTWSGGTPDATGNTATGAKVTPPAAGATGAAGAAGAAATPHLCMIFLENHAYSQIIGNGSMPHINTLASTYANCTKFYGVTHQSLPNYLALASGSDQGGLPDTYNPASNPLAGTTLVDSLKTAGIAWKQYAENLPSTGYLGGDTGGYVQHHNPWVYFKTVRNNSAQYNNIVNYSQLSTDLAGGTAPPIFFVQPTNTDNGHSGTDTQLDTFVNTVVPLITASTWYTAGNGIIVLWFDESHPDSDIGGIGDKGSNSQYPHGGQTGCIVISAKNSANTLATGLNHYGVLHAINNLYGLPALGDDAHTVNGDLTPLLTGNVGGGGGGGGGGTTSSNLGNGFFVKVPADTNPRQLNIYTEVNQGIATLAASLSDGSAPDLYDSTLANKTAASAGVYALSYAAANPNAFLNVFYTLSDGTTPGTAKASDTFTRGNQANLGTATDGETYQLVIEAGGPAWSIVSNQAQLTGSTGDSGVALLGSGTLLDGESALLVDLSNLADSVGLVLRASANAASYYRASLTGSSIVLAYVSGGVATILNSQPAILKTNTLYWLRFRILKNSLYARYWPNDGSKEPKVWHAMTVDRTIETAGQYGFRGKMGATSDTILYDTYSVVDLSANNDPSSVSLYAADLPTVIGTASGALSAIITTPAGAVDLTSEGTGDWAHWGYPSATSFDHKGSVTQLISNYSNIGSGTYTQNASALLSWSWEDGLVTPTVVASTTETDVTGAGNGFSFTLPADTNSRTVNVYVSAKKAQGTLTATLSDGSATAYTDSSLNDVTTGSVQRYAITYNAGSANQTLTIQWVLLTDNGGSGANTPLVLYGSTVAATTIATADKMATTTGGTEAHNVTHAPGSGANLYLEICSQGGTPGATSSLPAPTGKGWLYDSTALEGKTIPVGNWSAQSTLSDANTGAPSWTSPAIVMRFWKVNAGVYTAIGSSTLVNQSVPLSGTKKLFSFPNTSSGATAFGTGDKLYIDHFVQSGTGTANVWSGDALSCYVSNSATQGVANDFVVTTPGFVLTSGGTPGTIGLAAASVPLLIVAGGGGGGGGNPPPAVNATFTVNATDAVLPNTWQGLGAQVDPYLGPSYQATILADTPIRYYRLADTSGTVMTDIGSQLQNGTLHGGVTLAQTGLLRNTTNMAALFNGSTGYISLPTTGLPTGAAAFSLECWLQFASVPGGGNYPIMLNLGPNTSPNDAALYFNGDSQQFSLGLKGLGDIFSSITVTANHTYYLAGTYDGTTATFYCYDATAGTSDSTSSAKALSLSYGVALIGTIDASSFWFGGVLDEVAIYASTLTAAQVAAHYAAGTFLGLTTNQQTLVNARLNYMNPPLIRTCANSVSWWCPSGVVGTYNFYSPLMLEWYQVFENAQQNGINVIVGVNSPAPFTALSTSWCTAFADLIDQLVNNSGYTCVKYVSGLSEPDTF